MMRKGADETHPERRTAFRYIADCRVEYRMVGSGKEGGGRLVDISTGGVLFQPDEPLDPGLEIELTVGWPARPNSPAPIDLCIVGRVVRAESASTAVEILRYDFRPRAATEGVNAQHLSE